MKVLIAHVDQGEEIHKINHWLTDEVKELKPDFIFIAAPESLAIHSHMISELHMFEYSNVRYAVWNLIEDILYRIDELPGYHVAVYPSTGEFKCGETGYTGIYKGSSTEDGYILNEFVRKLFDQEIDSINELAIYLTSNELSSLIKLLDVFKPIVSINKALFADANPLVIRFGNSEFSYEPYPNILIRREIGDSENVLGEDEKRIVNLLGLTIENRLLDLYVNMDVRRQILDYIDDLISKVEYAFYNGSTSDREGYVLEVSHKKDVGAILYTTSLIKYFLKTPDHKELIDESIYDESIGLLKTCLSLVDSLGKLESPNIIQSLVELSKKYF